VRIPNFTISPHKGGLDQLSGEASARAASKHRACPFHGPAFSGEGAGTCFRTHRDALGVVAQEQNDTFIFLNFSFFNFYKCT
jgi:hypothetical protein